MTGENLRTRRKTCPNATLSTTNPTCIDLGSNPGHSLERPAANRLSQSTALILGLFPVLGQYSCVTYFIQLWLIQQHANKTWWWRQYAPLKRRSTIILHGSTSQKTILNKTCEECGIFPLVLNSMHEQLPSRSVRFITVHVEWAPEQVRTEWRNDAVHVLKMAAFRDIAACSHVVVDRRFRGACCLNRPDDGDSTHLWSFGLRLRDYNTLHPRNLWAS
jgi:hypothetical protein